jgi:hypothetical protein
VPDPKEESRARERACRLTHASGLVLSFLGNAARVSSLTNHAPKRVERMSLLS